MAGPRHQFRGGGPHGERCARSGTGWPRRPRAQRVHLGEHGRGEGHVPHAGRRARLSRRLRRPHLEVQTSDVFGGNPTHSFTFGPGGLLIFPLRAGASTVLSPTPDISMMLAAVEREWVTILFCAATTYRLLLNESHFERRYDLSSLRLLRQRRRDASSSGVRTLEGADWARHSGWVGKHGNVPHLHLVAGGPDQAGRDRSAGAGL